MQFKKVTLDQLLSELAELPADWMDDVAVKLIGELKLVVDKLRTLARPVTRWDIESALSNNDTFLDITRLFLGKGQEPFSHMLCVALNERSMSWAKLRRLAKSEPERVAGGLEMMGIIDVINDHLNRRWEVEDILIDRYKMSRGRAIAGQHRGRALENEVEAVLKGEGVAFQRGVTFIGKKNETAKCDFAIPSKEHPMIVIESKGFEATGSKLTDFLGDVLKIVQAKDYHMYFFLVTDGRGWHNRTSDLRKVVEFHQNGDVDMVFTRTRLSDLAAAVKQICKTEG